MYLHRNILYFVIFFVIVVLNICGWRCDVSEKIRVDQVNRPPGISQVDCFSLVVNIFFLIMPINCCPFSFYQQIFINFWKQAVNQPMRFGSSKLETNRCEPVCIHYENKCGVPKKMGWHRMLSCVDVTIKKSP